MGIHMFQFSIGYFCYMPHLFAYAEVVVDEGAIR